MTITSCPMCQTELPAGGSNACAGCGADLSRWMPKPPKIAVMDQNPVEIAQRSRLGLGVLGAFAGALIGSAVVFGLAVMAGVRFPLLGTAIGALTGLGARWLNKGGEEKLGMIAGGISMAAVFGTLYLMYGEFPMFNIISVIVSVSVAYRIAAK